MIKIKYAKSRLNANLNAGGFFIITGTLILLLSLIVKDWNGVSIDSIAVGQIFSGVALLLFYLFEKSKQYLTLKNGVLIKNSIFPSKINLNEVKATREFAGDLILVLDKSEFIIDTQIIDPHSMVVLKTELNKFNLL